MNDKRSFYPRNYSVSSRNHRPYAVSLTSGPAQAAAIDKTLTHLMVNRNLSRAGALEIIFLAGTEALASNPDFGCPPEVQGALKVHRELARIQTNRQLRNGLQVILEENGEEAFRAWASEQEVPVDGFLKDYRLMTPTRPWADMALDWLWDLLEASGGELSTAKVKARAISDRIIDDDEPGWEKLRQLASRNSLTGGRHGHWSLPTSVDALVLTNCDSVTL